MVGKSDDNPCVSNGKGSLPCRKKITTITIRAASARIKAIANAHVTLSREKKPRFGCCGSAASAVSIEIKPLFSSSKSETSERQRVTPA